MLLCPHRLAGPLALAGAIGALFSAGAAHAQVSVTPTITQAGSLYNYSYSITNFTNTNLAAINLDGLPLVPGALTNFSAPGTFGITNPYDSGVGIETFYEGTAALDTFSPGSTISGFSFSSIFAPATISFDTLDDSGGTATGTTLGPAGAAAVPEASTLVSLGAGLLVLGFAAARRRNAAAVVGS